MNLLKKIFPISAKFNGSTKNLVLGVLIYFALSIVTVPLLFVPVVGTLVTYYILFGTVITVLFQFNAFDEDASFGDIVKKIFYFSYKSTDTKADFVNAIIAYAALILIVPALQIYSVIGLILLIVDYCKKNKAAKAEVEQAEVENTEVE